MKRALAFLIFLIFLIFFGEAAAQESTISPVSIETDFVNPDIGPDEIQKYSILLTPTSGRVDDVRISTLGKVAQFIALERTSISLDYGETQEIEIELNAAGAKAGTYSGFLIIDVNDSVREIPIKIRVIEKETKIDMAVKVKTEKVKSPEPIKFLVTIYNVGQKEGFNLHLSHELKSAAGEMLAEREENVTLVTSLSLERSFYSEDLLLEAGTYYIETTVYYGDKSTTFVDTFTFVEPFWTTTKIAILAFVLILVSFAAGFKFIGPHNE